MIKGCDDAKVVDIETQTSPKNFTLVVPYYENPRFFDHQIKHWMMYPEFLRSHMKFIVVDDGSPDHPAKKVLDYRKRYYFGSREFLNIRLFRMEQDVRWGWLAARNRGVHQADTPWIMLTDMDHKLPLETVMTCVFGRHDPNIIYRFQRFENTGECINPHPNSWFMTRDMFFKIGGYDEALMGHYGTDGEYRRRCAKTAEIQIMSDHLVRHEHEGDSSTLKYKRKQLVDRRVSRLIKSRTEDWKPQILSYPWHEEL